MKGSIVPVIPKGDTVWFEYNPPGFESSKDVNWAEVGIPGLDFPLQQFVRGGLRTLSIEVYFNRDGYDRSFDVQAAVKGLEALTEKTDETLAPPVCLFSWGKFQVACVVGSVSTRYTMFDREGEPIEASVGLSLRSYMEAAEIAPSVGVTDEAALKEPVYSGKDGSGSAFAPAEEGGVKYAERLSSEGETRTHVVSAGETLQSISTMYYGSPAFWRVVDFANRARKGHVSVRDVKQGIELVIPDVRNPLGIIERITSFPPETMKALRASHNHVKPGLGV
jgi:Contractile injection system tube protein